MGKKSLILLISFFVGIGAAFAQNVTVRGSVTDASTGEGIPAASILVRGTLTGTSADGNGRYELNVPVGSTLEFSAVGYVTVAEAVNGRGVINVELKPDAEFLDDVIVVAYGTASRAAFTGSATQVKGDEIARVSNESLDKGLIGKISGVRITSDNGDPGSAANIQIRGVGSVSATTQPLYVVDGIIIDPSTSGDVGSGYRSLGVLNTINPEDIESMTVLKDAAAASLYGSRAANGVILITTKKGRSGKTTVTYTGEVGITQLANMKAFDIMDGPTFMQWVADSYDNYYQLHGYPAGTIKVEDLQADGWFYDGSGKTSTKWQNEVFRNATTMNHQIGVSGGNDRTQLYAGLGYTDNQGVVLGSRYIRLSGFQHLPAGSDRTAL